MAIQHVQICQILTEKINQLRNKHELLSSLLLDVRLLYGTQPDTRAPMIYQPGIVFLFSGHKIGYIDKQAFRYGINGYLLLTISLPFKCETFATPEVPLVGIRLDVDILQLQELLMSIGEDPLFQPAVVSSGTNSAALLEDILCAAERLLGVMDRPLDACILGEQTIREILYYVLTGPCGDALLALINRQTHFSLIGRVLKHIKSQYTENLSIDQPAAEASMNVSTFHHNLESVTNTSLLQCLGTYHLYRTRMLTTHNSIKASATAIRMGYESPSRFSRKFKHYFGMTPGKDAVRVHTIQGI